MKYLHAFKDRHKEWRYYFRRHGRRIALPGPFASVEFNEAYAAALAESTGVPQKRRVAKHGTFAALATRYYGSPDYKGLSPSSQTNYKRVIDSFLEKHGHRLVSQFTREHVDIIIGDMSETPGAGIVLLKRIRTLCRYGLAIKWLKQDPTAGAKSYKSKEIHTWTEDEIEKFEKYWASGTKQRLGFALHLYTGQRGSDIHDMVWSDIAADTIQVVQEKTDQEESDEKLIIPLHRALQRELSLVKRGHVAILTTAYGKPFTVKGFANFMSDAIREAELPECCVPHGLRKAAARRLAEAGCTSKQIAAITGHKSLAEIERYTRKADQVKLARQAIEKQSGNKSGKPTLKLVANRSRKPDK